jgi:hypothetical protein
LLVCEERCISGAPRFSFAASGLAMVRPYEY